MFKSLNKLIHYAKVDIDYSPPVILQEYIGMIINITKFENGYSGNVHYDIYEIDILTNGKIHDFVNKKNPDLLKEKDLLNIDYMILKWI